jgi:multiple sugar transport system substrate-binding protein
VTTGWLPIRRSAYDDERVTRACPQATVVAQQAQHPYSSFLTPDYDAITEALGREIIKALASKESPKVALAVAAHNVNAIVNARD